VSEGERERGSEREINEREFKTVGERKKIG
jgi:hypothetical protein